LLAISRKLDEFICNICCILDNDEVNFVQRQISAHISAQINFLHTKYC